MQELGLQEQAVLPWFVTQEQQGYSRVFLIVDNPVQLGALLRDAVRRCYATDEVLQKRAKAIQVKPSEVLATKMPDPGSVMSGDFGEIVSYIYLATRNTESKVVGAKKWRLKQDRTKPAPRSDIVQLVFSSWPNPSTDDRLICAEVKAKATDGGSTPIPEAIEGSSKDKTSRLAKTLTWLRERAIGEDIGTITVQDLDRFINATEFPQYTREFYAIAVICSSLVDTELAALVPADIPENCALVVMSVPNLQQTYTTVYEQALASIVDWPVPPGV
jgi:hypothetical protein